MMKKINLTLFLLFSLISLSQEKTTPFKDGEYLRYRMSYSGFLKAGTAELTLKEKELNGKKVYHAFGKGWTAAVVGWFFKVEDYYQSFFDTTTNTPYLFKRKINEGGYKKNKEITFNYKDKKAHIKDLLKKQDTAVSIGNIQDILSSFYYLRTQNTKNLKEGDLLKLDMFFDNKTTPLKLKYLGNQILKTRFGKIKTMVFKPLVQAGRVFKEKEAVTVWITADDNKIPIKIKASLAVGSLRAELERYKGLANSFKILF